MTDDLKEILRLEEALRQSERSLKKLTDAHLDLCKINTRALYILHRFGLENTGWLSWFQRWHYRDEPLRHDAANLVRHANFCSYTPRGTRLVGTPEEQI